MHPSSVVLEVHPLVAQVEHPLEVLAAHPLVEQVEHPLVVLEASQSGRRRIHWGAGGAPIGGAGGIPGGAGGASIGGAGGASIGGAGGIPGGGGGAFIPGGIGGVSSSLIQFISIETQSRYSPSDSLIV